MKSYIKYLIMSTIISLSLCGCNQEEEMGMGNSGDTVFLSLTVRGTTIGSRASVDATLKESTVSNAYFFFYPFDKTKTGLVLPYPSIESKDGKWSTKVSLPGLLKGREYKVYVLANVPQTTIKAALSSDDLLKVMPEEDTLLALTEELSTNGQNSDGSSISFMGELDSYVGGNNELSVSLTRTVAKFEAEFDKSGLDDKWNITSVRVLNEHKYTAYQSGGKRKDTRISTNTAFSGTLDADDKIKSIYYYTYENAASNSENERIKLEINLANNANETETRKYTATVNKTGNGEIVRNHIYKSKIYLNEKSEPVVVDIADIENWKDTTINAAVPDFYIDFPSDSIILDDHGGAIYAFKSNADSIYIDWDLNNLNINSLWGTEGYIYPKEGDVYELEMSMSAYDTHEEKGNMTLKAGNLTKEMGIRRPAAQNALSYTVIPLEEFSEGKLKTFDYDKDKGTLLELSCVGPIGVDSWCKVRLLSATRPDGTDDNRYHDVYLLPVGGGIGVPNPGSSVFFNFVDMKAEINIIETCGSSGIKGKMYVQLEIGTGSILFSKIIKTYRFYVQRD